jgi:prophage regulatory protein
MKAHRDNLLASTSNVGAKTSEQPTCRDGRPPGVGRRFLSYTDLIDRGIRFSRVHLRRMEKAGVFPMHITLGAGNGMQTSIAWLAEEVIAWENAKIARRDADHREVLATA